MRHLICTGFAVATLALAGGAQAQSPDAAGFIESFDQICIDTLAEREQVRALMETGGWMPAPEGMFPADETMRDPEVWLRSDRGGLAFAFVADMHLEDEEYEIPLRGCAVGVTPVIAGLEESLQAWAGVAPLEGFGEDDGSRAYGFSIRDGAATPAAPMSRLDAVRAILNNEFSFVTGRSDEEMSMLMHLAPAF